MRKMVFLNLNIESINAKSNYHNFDICSIEAFDVQYERLEHAKFHTINRMKNPDLLPKYDMVST